MRFCRFLYNNKPQFGLVESVAGADTITRLLNAHLFEAEDLDDLPSMKIPNLPLASAQLLAPVAPQKIVCIGRNYADHAKELGNLILTEDMVLFFKPPSSLIGHNQPVKRPPDSERVDYEGELGVILRRECRHLREDEDIADYILGYTIVNDVTARDLQKKDVQWVRGKGYDTFCPVGPVVVTDPLDLKSGVQVETRVNGETKQSGNTRDFIFPLDFMLRYISRIMTLYPGDLIPTGTPSGVGPVVAGDVMEVSVEGIGTLRNPVEDEKI
jgi:2-keto-4-pentenoate hydratase/2-oxohepta-3-ene-1,7-dioic acid hydratase in catechol pathway